MWIFQNFQKANWISQISSAFWSRLLFLPSGSTQAATGRLRQAAAIVSSILWWFTRLTLTISLAALGVKPTSRPWGSSARQSHQPYWLQKNIEIREVLLASERPDKTRLPPPIAGNTLEHERVRHEAQAGHSSSGARGYVLLKRERRAPLFFKTQTIHKNPQKAAGRPAHTPPQILLEQKKEKNWTLTERFPPSAHSSIGRPHVL